MVPSHPFIIALFFFPAIESNVVYREGIPFSSYSSRTFRRRTFIKHEFHHLNVPLAGTAAVFDEFDCTFECLSNPLCFSVNLAASKGAHGRLWCELLSSDKYRNSTEYEGNKSSHHLAIEVGEIWCKLIRFLVTYHETSYLPPYLVSVPERTHVPSNHHISVGLHLPSKIQETFSYSVSPQSPCSSSPCQNEATCVTNYRDGSFECLCAKGFKGEYCEKGE